MGQTIDNRYRIIEKIGEGGMGAVYVAEDTRLQRKVAIKRLQIAGGIDDTTQFQQRFEREALVMARFQHPNIVSVFDYGHDDDGLYLVLEYMQAGSLTDLMKKKRLNVDEAIEIMLPLAAALQAIHDRERVHRDIKPANILFDEYHNPKLADFGVVKMMESQEQTLTAVGAAVGTPAYMAPELIAGTASPAADQYALGVVFYELVTGKKPFQGRTAMETMSMAMYEPLPDPRSYNPSLPNWVSGFLSIALAKSADERFISMKGFSDALKNGGQAASQMEMPTQIDEEDATMLASSPGGYQEAPTTVARSTKVSTLPEPVINYAPIADSEDATEIASGEYSQPAATDMAAELATEPPSVQRQQNTPVTPAKAKKGMNKKVLIAIIAAGGLLALVACIIVGVFFYPTISESLKISKTERIYESVKPSSLAATPPECTEIGQEWVNPVSQMIMVCVPAGEFTMGNDENFGEGPMHKVYLDAYWIDKTEVTRGQYQQCVDDGVCVKPTYTDISILPDYAITGVNWYQAATYCEWVGGQLPTNAQWEKAARGTDGRTYPWGEMTPTCELAKFEYEGEACGTSYERTVGLYPAGASPYGALDMSGNVEEWVWDWYQSSYYGESPYENPMGPLGDNYQQKIIRGGDCYSEDVAEVTTSAFDGRSPESFLAFGGMRCVIEP